MRHSTYSPTTLQKAHELKNIYNYVSASVHVYMYQKLLNNNKPFSLLISIKAPSLCSTPCMHISSSSTAAAYAAIGAAAAVVASAVLDRFGERDGLRLSASSKPSSSSS
jgi:hypothetical protein